MTYAELQEGRKDDSGKPRMDLLPFDALLDVGDVLAYGAQKYAARNWEKGMDRGRLVAATLRHLANWAMGQENDPESGRHHLAHVACDALMLLALHKRGLGVDSRKAAP